MGNITEICLVGVMLLFVGGWTGLTRLTVSFHNLFVNVSVGII
jgi:hypothetical protein